MINVKFESLWNLSKNDEQKKQKFERYFVQPATFPP